MRNVSPVLLLLVGPLLGLVSIGSGGCLGPVMETRTDTIRISTDPSGARVWVKDDSGQRYLDPSPMDLEQEYQVEVTEFNRWLWAGFAGSIVASTLGSLFIYFGSERMDAQYYSGIGNVAVGGVGLILSLIYCIRGEMRHGQERVVAKNLTIGADLSGFRSQAQIVEWPSSDKQLKLSLAEDKSAPTTPGPGPRRAIVAVFDVHDSVGLLKADELVQLTAYLSTALTSTGLYKTIPRDQLRARLLDEKAGSYKVCVDESCQIELGKTLAAQKTLATQVLKVGQKCAVTANLYDLKTETAEKGAMVNTGCQADELLKAMQQVVEQLGAK